MLRPVLSEIVDDGAFPMLIRVISPEVNVITIRMAGDHYTILSGWIDPQSADMDDELEATAAKAVAGTQVGMYSRAAAAHLLAVRGRVRDEKPISSHPSLLAARMRLLHILYEDAFADGPDKDKVVIRVKNGVAETVKAPSGIEVEIIDEDEEEASR